MFIQTRTSAQSMYYYSFETMRNETIKVIAAGCELPYTDIPERHHFIQRELCFNLPHSVLCGIANGIL